VDRNKLVRWIVGLVAALAVVALIVWADRQSGIDDRDTDPEDVQVESQSTVDDIVIHVDGS